MSGLFILFEEVGGGLGRITQSAAVAGDAEQAALYEKEGVSYIRIPMDGNEGYVKIVDGDVSFHERPAYEGSWDKTEIEPGEVATLPNVPRCKIRISGPLISWDEEHEGGDLAVIFALSGIYEVLFEAFPMKLHYSQLNVRSRTRDVSKDGVADA